jgi:hypothetical protein
MQRHVSEPQISFVVPRMLPMRLVVYFCGAQWSDANSIKSAPMTARLSILASRNIACY